LKIKLDKFDLYDLAKVTDEGIEDTVDAGWVGLGEVDRAEASFRLTEALVDQTLTC